MWNSDLTALEISVLFLNIYIFDRLFNGLWIISNRDIISVTGPGIAKLHWPIENDYFHLIIVQSLLLLSISVFRIVTKEPCFWRIVMFPKQQKSQVELYISLKPEQQVNGLSGVE